MFGINFKFASIIFFMALRVECGQFPQIFNGNWKEDITRRGDGEKVLRAFGIPVTNKTILPGYSTSQNITEDGGNYMIDGFGQDGMEYSIKLYVCTGENKTHDFGMFGGVANYSSALKGGYIEMQTFPHNESQKLITRRQVWSSNGTDMLEYRFFHAKSGMSVSSYFFRV